MKIGFVKFKLKCKYDINVIVRNISLNNIKGEIKIKLHFDKNILSNVSKNHL